MYLGMPDSSPHVYHLEIYGSTILGSDEYSEGVAYIHNEPGSLDTSHVLGICMTVLKPT